MLVLSHRGWQEKFGGAADVLGRRVTMHDDGTIYTVVGVMPQGLDYPRGTDVWMAVLQATSEKFVPFLAVNVVGRLAPGATPAMARDEMTAFYQRDGVPEWQRDLRGAASGLPELVQGDSRAAVIVFGADSALLLLITCINVANLLLVRGASLLGEVAVRSALGARRGRLVG